MTIFPRWTTTISAAAKPTSHKVYGEGIAVLAGDALLTIAFEMAASCRAWPRYSHADVIHELAVAAGSQKLIAGQVADLEGEGKKISPAELRYIHDNKTAALISSSIRLGAMSANATPKQLAGLTDFGESLGLAFQVIDDILDVTQTTEKLGKSAGKDVAAQKATYPALPRVGESQERGRSPDRSRPRRAEAFRQERRSAGSHRGLSAQAGKLINAGGVLHTCNCWLL